MINSVKSTSSIMIELLKSTGKYVYTHLPSSHKDVYIDTLKKCISIIESSPDDYEKYVESINQLKNDVDVYHQVRFFNKKVEQRKNHDIACNHALDIVNKLHARFNVGGFDPEPRNYKNKGFIISNNDGLFD